MITEKCHQDTFAILLVADKLFSMSGNNHVGDDLTQRRTTLLSLSLGSLVAALSALAVMEHKCNPAAPDEPTFLEAGGPKSVEATSWVALMAPAGTPAATVGKFSRAVNQALRHSDVVERLSPFGLVTQLVSPADLGSLNTDPTRNAELAKRGGASFN